MAGSVSEKYPSTIQFIFEPKFRGPDEKIFPSHIPFHFSAKSCPSVLKKFLLSVSTFLEQNDVACKPQNTPLLFISFFGQKGVGAEQKFFPHIPFHF